MDERRKAAAAQVGRAGSWKPPSRPGGEVTDEVEHHAGAMGAESSSGSLRAERMTRLTQPGSHVVDSEIYCMITRFGLRRPWHLVAARREFNQLAAAGSMVPGLLDAVFLVEDPTTFHSVSLWSRPPSLSEHLERHVDAANRVFGRLVFDPERGPELCSTTWRLTAVTNNLNWGRFDLRSEILDGMGSK